MCNHLYKNKNVYLQFFSIGKRLTQKINMLINENINRLQMQRNPAKIVNSVFYFVFKNIKNILLSYS